MSSPALAFHHLGLACRSISKEARHLASLGYAQVGETFEDPLQGVRGCFLEGPGPRLELLEPLAGSTTLDGFLARGVKMYHQAFETPCLDAALEWHLGRRARVVSPPKPAVAFGGRRVAFIALPTMLIVELIEAPQEDASPQ